MNIYELGGDEGYQAIMRKARATNRERDTHDRERRGIAPSEQALDGFLRTAICAINCGINTKDWDCVAEGLDMIQQAEVRVRSHQ